jgi:tripartite-type tricarboxylate transporter receptor subunit TctC
VRRPLRGVAASLLLALAVAVSAPSRAAERYPARTIKLIVAFAPGGVADIMGRLIAQALQGKLGQAVVVENKPGGDGLIGMGEVVPRPTATRCSSAASAARSCRR